MSLIHSDTRTTSRESLDETLQYIKLLDSSDWSEHENHISLHGLNPMILEIPLPFRLMMKNPVDHVMLNRMV